MTKLKHFFNKNLLEVGVDEVARGCLGGRVYAAAVIWNPNFEKNTGIKIPDIKDSKKVKPELREEYSDFIKYYAIDYGIGWVDEKEIDKINIRNASFKAMKIALDNLSIKPECILVDGNAFEGYNNIDYECIVKGDNKVLSIAMASILAKTSRDNYIIDLVKKNPELKKYGWIENNSYGTEQHLNAIKKYGVSDYHRKTFGICKEILKGNSDNIDNTDNTNNSDNTDNFDNINENNNNNNDNN